MKLSELLDCCADVQVNVFDGFGRKLFVYDVEDYAENSKPENFAAYFLYKDMEVKEIHAEHEKEFSLPFINAVLVDVCDIEYHECFCDAFRVAYEFREQLGNKFDCTKEDILSNKYSCGIDYFARLFKGHCPCPQSLAVFLESLF